jgi:hypothetical protein
MSTNRTDTLLAWSWLMVIGLGLVALWSRKRALTWILLSTFALALLASALHMYPLRLRLLLFLLPAVYLLLAEGIRSVFKLLSRVGLAPAWLISGALCVGLLWPSLVDARRTLVEPVRFFDMRGVVQHVERNWMAGDGILVSGGGETFAYYSESFGLEPGTIIVDTSHRIIRYRAYLDYLDSLAVSPRVWVIFAHFQEDPSYTRYSDYLEKQGAIDHVEMVGFARVYLWIPKQWLHGGTASE